MQRVRAPKHFRQKKANIMFLVLYIMFISSLIGLLVSQYIQYMIKTAAIFQDYYSTYYLAYGGLEMGLTQVKYHGYGFETELSMTGSSCRTTGCRVNTTVVSRSSVIANTYDQRPTCNALAVSGGTQHTYARLGSGDCFITPLYYDTTQGFNPINYQRVDSNQFLNTAAYNPTLYNQYVGSGGVGEMYSLRIIDEGLQNLDSVLEPTAASPTQYAFSTDMSPYGNANNNYLITANPSSTTKEFCLELSNNNKLPMKYVSVVSIGMDGKSTIALNAVKNNELPSFLCYGAINP